MKGADARPVAIGLRVYRGLAAAFPHEFRNVYGDAMTLTAEDAVEMIWRERGWLGIAICCWIWLCGFPRSTRARSGRTCDTGCACCAPRRDFRRWRWSL